MALRESPARASGSTSTASARVASCSIWLDWVSGSVPPSMSAANVRMVGVSKKGLRQKLRPNCSRRRSNRVDNRMEWPPRLKKLSSIESSPAGNPSSSPHTSASCACKGSCMRQRSIPMGMGIGMASKALRSILPLFERGMHASSLQALGCICTGNHCRACSFRLASVAPDSGWAAKPMTLCAVSITTATWRNKRLSRKHCSIS